MSDNVKCMGLHSEEILKCGCMIKRYISGLSVIDEPKCKRHMEKNMQWECRTCNKKFAGKKQLKKHRWSHAI